MTPQTIKNYIRARLGNQIGTYTTPKGATYPALRISPPEVPNDWRVEGVEVIIFKSPRQLGGIQPTTGGGSLKRRNWVVRVSQFDLSQSIQPTIDMIQTIFPVTYCSQPTRQQNTNYETVTIEIKDPTFIGAGVADCCDPTWDSYPYTPTYSTSLPLTAAVTYQDLTSDLDKGFVSGFVADQSLRADLGNVEDVNRVTIECGNLPGYGNTSALINGTQIQTSIDGIHWIHVQTVVGVTDNNGKNVFTFPQTNYCRYVRLYQPSPSGLALIGLWINA